MSLQFDYQPLKADEIRLLQLGYRRTDADPLTCRIVHTTLARCSLLDSFFAYNALSYVWGGPRKSPILCSSVESTTNEKHILVSSNLIKALRAISRRPLSAHQVHHTLWVDAICINQDDIKERGHQVRLMTEIYHTAETVLVWLDDSQALEACVTTLRNGPSIVSWYDQHSQLQFRYEIGDWISSLKELFIQPWFRRIWVIQEVAVSQQVKILCGDSDLYWREIVSLVISIPSGQTLGMDGRVFCEAVLLIELLQHVLRKRRDPLYICKDCRLQKGGTEPKDLLELIQATQHYEATEPKDKIYALLGIACELEADHFAKAIEPDYSLSTDDLLLRVATMFTRTFRPLRILRSLGNSCSPEQTRTSWVPAWNLPRNHRALSDLIAPHERLSLEHRAMVFKISYPGALKLGGKLLDTVAWLGEAYPEPGLALAGEHTTGRLYPISRLYYGQDTFLSRWLMLARKYTAYPSMSMIQYFEHLITLDRTNFLKLNEDSFLTRINEVCKQRRLIITRSGRLCLGPAHTKAQDSIVLFPGSPLPFVISRAVGNSQMWKLLGECYIQGIDLGKAIQDNESALATFELQ